MTLRRYFLGCPGWGVKTWVGRLFPPGTRPQDFLSRYAEVFNTVEGNTTFYALPSVDTVARWRDQVPDAFRFAFKFPRTITHDRMLDRAATETAQFLDRVALLGPKLGTLMLQLPPRFGPDRLPALARFLDALPPDHRYAVELRHEAFFIEGPDRTAVLDVLRARDVDLVMMDARGLHASTDVATLDVRAQKPDLPVLVTTTGLRPIVRFVPPASLEDARPYVETWVAHAARWIAAGATPTLFVHAPDDTYAPEHAYALHDRLRRLTDVGDLPPWPGPPRQMDLF